ncbi:hypothetical protein KIW84_072695 [Lathyrus oleraceus]|uniref:Uncharacterized protein n=1 Tax=Pisum sativum TaxID=3888 RepID=A0A9D4VP83_PEA|nr:hypothetical protein KIW84_072695 [Pisum sativum]
MQRRLARRKVYGKRIYVNVPATPVDNVSFHSVTSVQSRKEYKKVYDREKCVKFSPQIIGDYMGRSKVTSIDKIMTMEEEETASEDEEEHYLELLKYNEIMELHSDVQLLKTVLIAGSCYHKLMKEIEVKNEDIPFGCWCKP